MLSAQQTVNDTRIVSHDSIPHNLSFEAEAYYYILPGEKNTATLIGYADYKAFHSEVRYNYEDLQTISVFGGYGFSTGHSFIAEVTPIIGFAAGNTDGVIPGLLLNLTWGKFDFYSESEYVMNFEGKENNYFYTWSELGYDGAEMLVLYGKGEIKIGELGGSYLVGDEPILATSGLP